MNAVRLGLILSAAVTVLGTAACAGDKPAPAYDALAAPSASASAAAQPADVDAGIIDALTAATVTWTDGEVVPADSGPGYTIRKLAGAAHQHTAPVAANVKLYLPFDAEGLVHLDKDNLGTVECTVLATFKSQVLGNTMTAPRISFDANGDVVKMAARYQS